MAPCIGFYGDSHGSIRVESHILGISHYTEISTDFNS